MFFFSLWNVFVMFLFVSFRGSFGFFRRRRLYGRGRRRWRRSRRFERFCWCKVEVYFCGDVVIIVIVIVWKLYEISFDILYVFF